MVVSTQLKIARQIGSFSPGIGKIKAFETTFGTCLSSTFILLQVSKRLGPNCNQHTVILTGSRYVTKNDMRCHDASDFIWFDSTPTQKNLQLAMFAGDWINVTLRSIDRKGFCVKSLRICWIVGLIYDCQHATMYPQCFLVVFAMNTIQTRQVVQKAVFYGQAFSASEQFMPPCRDTITNTVGLGHVETRWWL